MTPCAHAIFLLQTPALRRVSGQQQILGHKTSISTYTDFMKMMVAEYQKVERWTGVLMIWTLTDAVAVDVLHFNSGWHAHGSKNYASPRSRVVRWTFSHQLAYRIRTLCISFGHSATNVKSDTGFLHVTALHTAG